MCALVLCGVISESRCVCRKRKVVIDSLRTMNIGDMIVFVGEELGNSVCCRSCVIATDRNEKFDVVVFEKIEIETFFEVFIGWFETAHFEV